MNEKKKKQKEKNWARTDITECPVNQHHYWILFSGKNVSTEYNFWIWAHNKSLIYCREYKE